MVRIIITGCLLLGSLPAFAQSSFDAAQLLTDVRALSADSMAGRLTGTEGARKARGYIVRAFQREGVAPFKGSYLQPFPLHQGTAGSEGVNVVGYVEGSEQPDSVIVISAHYDHLGVVDGEIYNGADDNASGVAGLLAAAGYFSRHPPRHSLLFAAFDAEEMGLQGAEAFLKEPPVALSQIQLNINLDMIGRNAAGELFASGTSHYPAMKPYLEGAAAQGGVKLRFGHDRAGQGEEDWTGSSDHGPFHRAGIPYLYFGVEDHADYHRPTDDYERLSPAFFKEAVRLIIDAAVSLDRNLAHLDAGSRVHEAGSAAP